MSGLFRKPSIPDPPKIDQVQIPVAPTVDDAQRIREEADRRRRRRGRAATMLTGEGGAGLPQTSAATLLAGNP